MICNWLTCQVENRVAAAADSPVLCLLCLSGSMLFKCIWLISQRKTSIGKSGMCDKGNISDFMQFSVNFLTWWFVTDLRIRYFIAYFRSDLIAFRLSKASMRSYDAHTISFIFLRLSAFIHDDDWSSWGEIRESPADQKRRGKNMSESNCSNIIDAIAWCFATFWYFLLHYLWILNQFRTELNH